MIYLTSDVHHMGLKTADQSFLSNSTGSEFDIAIRFFQLCCERSIKLTSFITGRAAIEEQENLKMAVNLENVEVGGHNYSAFKPEIAHRFYLKIFGSYNGTYAIQMKDVKKTCAVMKSVGGVNITSWRNHAYFNDENTADILYKNGIRIFSDGVKKDNFEPVLNESGIYELPINIIPDHEHIFHSDRTPYSVDKWIRRYNWSDDFGSKSCYLWEWIDQFFEQVIENEKKGKKSVILIHPICFYILDEWESLTRIIEFLAGFESNCLSEAIDYEHT